MTRGDIERAANFLLDKYGQRSAAEAAENLEWMLAHDDMEGAAYWRRVMSVLRDASAPRPEDTPRVS